MWLHYVSSKGAIIAMTRALARELGDDNVTVNAIAPGLTLTDASLGLMDNAAEYGVMRGALKRAAVSGDIVGAVLFLASPHATFVTGQTLVVDGGRQFLCEAACPAAGVAAGVTRQTCCRRRRRPAARPACRSRRRPGGPARRPSSLRKPVSTSMRLARRLAVGERHEDHLVAAARLAVPRAVLADEHAVRDLGAATLRRS